MKLLNELCEINIGKTPARANEKYWNGEHKWLAISDLKSKYIINTKEGITEKAINECNMKLIPKDTVVMSFKLSLGKSAILKEQMYSNEAIASFPIKNPDKVIPEFLYYALKTVNLEKYADKAAKGVTLNKRKLNLIEIPYTDIEGQKKIVEVLELAEKLVKNRQTQITALDELSQSVFLKMFGDITLNQKGFDKVKLSDILLASPQNGLYKPADEYMDSGVPIVRIDSFYKGKITKIDNLKRVNCTRKEIDTYRLNINDIVINRVNSIQYLGKCGLVEKLNEETVFESNMMRIRPDTGKVNPLFLIAVLNSQYIYNQILKRAKHSVNQSSINQTDVGNFDIVLPNLDLQSKFAEKVNQIEKQKKKMETSLVILFGLYDALLQKAFKGELF